LPALPISKRTPHDGWRAFWASLEKMHDQPDYSHNRGLVRSGIIRFIEEVAEDTSLSTAQKDIPKSVYGDPLEGIQSHQAAQLVGV
jgi:hypothetical protein